MIYLDNSATTRVLDEAAACAAQAMTQDFFNPASAYPPAVATEKRVDEARARLAAAFGRSDGQIVYTSGATESNNMAILGSLRGVRGLKRVVSSVSEHPSVYALCKELAERQGVELALLPAAHDGSAPLDALESALTPDTALVSLMHVNNETGAITDIRAAAAIIRRRAPGAIFHMDGVQAFCKLPFASIPCDLYSVSAHKFHGPKGVGALFVKNGLRFFGGQIGGGQEKGLRSGTVNVPGILGMDAALRFYRADQPKLLAHMAACKLRLYTNLLAVPDAVVNGPAPQSAAPHVLNMSFPGVRGEVLLHALAEKGMYVSTGSACSAHKKGANRVLAALGVSPARQESALRFSLCPFNTEAEMDEAAQMLCEQVAFLRRYQRR